uniref:G-patch domain-containing protein n=1 Tax=Taeniopygia guttata TaxID=59729 RepID=A0A674GZ99_TAEGU
MGAQLMRKMGWREGEGLGKNKEGSVEPIMVDFKTDRKGLVAVGEKAQKRSGHYVVMKDLSGKHPVSALMEICNKRRWTPPSSCWWTTVGLITANISSSRNTSRGWLRMVEPSRCWNVQVLFLERPNRVPGALYSGIPGLEPLWSQARRAGGAPLEDRRLQGDLRAPCWA